MRSSRARASRRAAVPSPFLTPEEAAERSGISVPHLLRRLEDGALPGYRFGRTWLIPAHELEDQLHQDPTAPDDVELLDVVLDLTAQLPRAVNGSGLEEFFRVSHARRSDVLSTPSLEPVAKGRRIFTQGAIIAALFRARNECPPRCLQHHDELSFA